MNGSDLVETIPFSQDPEDTSGKLDFSDKMNEYFANSDLKELDLNLKFDSFLDSKGQSSDA